MPPLVMKDLPPPDGVFYVSVLAAALLLALLPLRYPVATGLKSPSTGGKDGETFLALV